MIIPCLSVRAPWSWAIVHAGKHIENRTRRFGYRGPLLIHASKAVDLHIAWHEIEQLSGLRPPTQETIGRGGIVGACRLVDCLDPIDHDDRWRQANAFGLHLTSAIALPFRAYRGALGLFKVELTPAEESALRAVGILPAGSP